MKISSMRLLTTARPIDVTALVRFRRRQLGIANIRGSLLELRSALLQLAGWTPLAIGLR